MWIRCVDSICEINVKITIGNHRDTSVNTVQHRCECENSAGVNRQFGNGSKNEIFTLHTPHQIPQISYIQPLLGQERVNACTGDERPES